MTIETLRQRLDALVRGDFRIWETLADGSMLAALRGAVREVRKAPNDIEEELRRLRDILTNQRSEFLEQLARFCHSQLGAMGFQDADAANPDPMVTQAVERLHRNALGMVETARAAASAMMVSISPSIWHPKLVEMAQDACNSLSHGPVMLAPPIGISKVIDPVGAAHAVFRDLAAHGSRVAAARDWTLSWLDKDGYGASPLHSVRAPIAGFSAGTGGFIAELCLDEIEGVEGDLCEHIIQALRPLGSELIGLITNLNQRGNRPPGRCVRWHLKVGADGPSGWVMLDGKSLGGAAAAGFDILRMPDTTYLPERLIVAAVGAGDSLVPVGYEQDKLDKAVKSPIGGTKLLAAGLGQGSSFLASHGAKWQGIKLRELKSVAEAVKFARGHDDETTGPVVVVVVLGTDGGVGKGSFVACVAQLFAEAGEHVAIIDMDLVNSNTTIAAGHRFPHECTDTRSVFDHLALHVKGVGGLPRVSKQTLLWDITPHFLRSRGLGAIRLLPAWTRNDQQFRGSEVKAHVLAQHTAAIFPRIVEEMCERVKCVSSKTRLVLLDCGAAFAEPLYLGGCASADLGFIVTKADPNNFQNIARIKQSLLHYHPGQAGKLGRFAILFNNVASEPAKELCSSYHDPDEPATGVAWNDPLMLRDRSHYPLDFDLDYDKFSATVRDLFVDALLKLGPASPQARTIRVSVPSHDDLANRPVWSLIVAPGRFKELAGPSIPRVNLVTRKTLWGAGVALVGAVVWLVIRFLGAESLRSMRFRDPAILAGASLLALGAAGFFRHATRRKIRLYADLAALPLKDWEATRNRLREIRARLNRPEERDAKMWLESLVSEARRQAKAERQWGRERHE